jgi:hypothetical protein
VSLSIISNTGIATEIVERNIPVTMRIYREGYPSSLYIKCKVEDINGVSFSKFDEKKDTVKKEFKLLISSIKNNDEKSFRAFGANYRGRVYNDDIIKKADANLNGLQNVFGYYDKHGTGLKIYKRLLIGDGGIFIFGTDAKNARSDSFKSQRLSVQYENISSNKIDKTRWSCAEQSVPLLNSMITTTFQQIARHPERYQEKQKTAVTTTFDYSILIPGTEGENPAYLQFNGKTYNIDVMHEKVPANDKILSFYQNAYLVWQNVSTQEFLKYYTRSSQERIQKAEMKSPGYLDKARKSLSKGRKVLFIMDAEPFYVVFCRIGSNKVVQPEYIVIDPDDGKLKLNLATMDSVTQYFMFNEFQLILNKVAPNIFKIPQSVK